MTRVHKTVLWTLAACVFGYIAVHVLIVKAPGPALAQQPPEEPAGAIPLPEDDRGGPGEERAAPASALEPARALVAVCVGDKGEPLDDVIVDIVRETATESPFDPRVEPYGQATSKDGGRLSFALPPIRHRITGQAGIYILYFTAPGRPIKSVVVENDTALPKEIAIPKESAEHVYAPTHHIVVAKSKGISISPLHSAIRAFTKDGKIYRVVEFVDERTGVDKAPGKQTASGSWKPSPANPEDDVASMTIPKTGNGGRYGAGYGGSMADSGMPMSPPAAQDRITSARQKLTDARTDKEKQAARAQLRKLLAEIFAQDMQMREQQAAEIESRLANLRRQYQAREKVKEEIIDLQLKVIEQDAAGLGFPGGGPGFPGGLPRSGVGGSGFQSGGQGAMTAPQPAGRRSGVSVERPLAEFKQQQALIGELNKYGHFAESTDGKLYAHVSSNHPRGPSFIFVVDSQTGKLVGTAAVNSVVGPILFTKEGLASRENDLLELRIRLTRRAGPDGDVFEVGSADLNPFDPMTVALDPEFLKKYSSKPQARVGELAARGHFVGSPDGKLYAYVETSGDNMPERSALVRVCDVRTGQRVAGTRIKPPVGKLRFFNHGVFTEDADGKLTLRIRLNRRTGPEGDVFEVGSADLNPVDPLTVITAGGDVVELPGTANGATHSLRADMAAEFNELRIQYLQTKGRWSRTETQFSHLLAEARRQNPKASIDDVKKLHLDAWRATEQALRDYVAAHNQIETQLELLAIDLKSATLTLEVEELKLLELMQRNKDQAASESEVNQQRDVVKAATLGVERISQLIKMYTSIKSEPVPTEDALPTGMRDRADESEISAVSSGAQVASVARVPKLAGEAGVSVRDMLAIKPEGDGIDYDQPTGDEIDACRVVLESGEAWTLLDRNLVLLRRFVDKNRDGVVDLWAYYKSGQEVWRDVDTDFDGKADHHEGADPGTKFVPEDVTKGP